MSTFPPLLCAVSKPLVLHNPLTKVYFEREIKACNGHKALVFWCSSPYSSLHRVWNSQTGIFDIWEDPNRKVDMWPIYNGVRMPAINIQPPTSSQKEKVELLKSLSQVCHQIIDQRVLEFFQVSSNSFPISGTAVN